MTADAAPVLARSIAIGDTVTGNCHEAKKARARIAAMLPLGGGASS